MTDDVELKKSLEAAIKRLMVAWRRAGNSADAATAFDRNDTKEKTAIKFTQWLQVITEKLRKNPNNPQFRSLLPAIRVLGTIEERYRENDLTAFLTEKFQSLPSHASANQADTSNTSFRSSGMNAKSSSWETSVRPIPNSSFYQNNPNVRMMHNLALEVQRQNRGANFAAVNQFLAKFYDAAYKDQQRINTDLNTIDRESTAQAMRFTAGQRGGIGGWNMSRLTPWGWGAAGMNAAYAQQGGQVWVDGARKSQAANQLLQIHGPQMAARSASKRNSLIAEFDATHYGDPAWEAMKQKIQVMDVRQAELAQQMASQMQGSGGMGIGGWIATAVGGLLGFTLMGGGFNLTSGIGAAIGGIGLGWLWNNFIQPWVSNLMKPSPSLSGGIAREQAMVPGLQKTTGMAQNTPSPYDATDIVKPPLPATARNDAARRSPGQVGAIP